MTETTVVNIHHSQCDVLIDRTTVFGNPFPEWKWGREECIHKFETYFWNRIERDPAWKAEVLRLKGKVLGCWCRPLSCHGDIYAGYLNSYDEIERLKLISQLDAIWSDIDCLATNEGWYEPELQGEAIYRLSQIDNDVARGIVSKQASDPDYDVLGEILNLIKGGSQ